MSPAAGSAFVVRNEYDGHHDPDDDSQGYSDGQEQKQWRCCTVGFLDNGFETLHLGDRMVDESLRLS